MFTIFFCSRVYSVLVHTCQAGGTEEWHYLCVAGQNSQIFLFCLFVRDWSHVSKGGWGVALNADEGSGRGLAKCWILAMGLGLPWQGWAADPLKFTDIINELPPSPRLTCRRQGCQGRPHLKYCEPSQRCPSQSLWGAGLHPQLSLYSSATEVAILFTPKGCNF